MLGKFHLIDAPISWPVGGSLWEMVEVSFGLSTDWDLRLLLERDGQIAEVVFPTPTSFRVHDERELLSYWAARADQGVQIGTFYSLEDSSVVQSFLQVESMPLRHFLVAGVDICVEVIGTNSPRVLTDEKAPPTAT